MWSGRAAADEMEPSDVFNNRREIWHPSNKGGIVRTWRWEDWRRRQAATPIIQMVTIAPNRLDLNDDGLVTPLDTLMVVNRINQQPSATGRDTAFRPV